MGEKTKIEYADHTANAWRGCSRQHLGCLHCYAAELAVRFPATFGAWGIGGARVVAERVYGEVRKWNRRAACCCRKESCDHEHEAGCPQRRPPVVFWNDVSDTFEDHPVLIEPRKRMFCDGIDANPNLIHLLVTKRPENVRRMWPDRSADVRYGKSKHGPSQGTPNPFPHTTRIIEHSPRRNSVWLLYSASDQQTLDAGLPHLLACRDLVPVLGLSLEPLVGPVDLPLCFHSSDDPNQHDHSKCAPIPDWIVCGGESGPRARPCDVKWVRSIVEQCRAAGVACYVKQLGANIRADGEHLCGWPLGPDFHGTHDTTYQPPRIFLSDSKGGDPAEWPEDLRVRQFPKGLQ